jgi:hypothetical protein
MKQAEIPIDTRWPFAVRVVSMAHWLAQLVEFHLAGSPVAPSGSSAVLSSQHFARDLLLSRYHPLGLASAATGDTAILRYHWLSFTAIP